MMFEIKNLTVFYQDKNQKLFLLNDISFTLDKGETLGIISKTGDGKSTLAKALLGIYDSNIH